jgi:hypothetical protein
MRFYWTRTCVTYVRVRRQGVLCMHKYNPTVVLHIYTPCSYSTTVHTYKKNPAIYWPICSCWETYKPVDPHDSRGACTVTTSSSRQYRTKIKKRPHAYACRSHASRGRDNSRTATGATGRMSSRRRRRVRRPAGRSAVRPLLVGLGAFLHACICTIMRHTPRPRPTPSKLPYVRVRPIHRSMHACARVRTCVACIIASVTAMQVRFLSLINEQIVLDDEHAHARTFIYYIYTYIGRADVYPTVRSIDQDDMHAWMRPLAV